MNTRPMTKEDNAIYASRSGIVLMAGAQASQAKDAAMAQARAADRAIDQRFTFVSAVVASIEYWRDAGADLPHSVY